MAPPSLVRVCNADVTTLAFATRDHHTSRTTPHHHRHMVDIPPLERGQGGFMQHHTAPHIRRLLAPYTDTHFSRLPAGRQVFASHLIHPIRTTPLHPHKVPLIKRDHRHTLRRAARIPGYRRAQLRVRVLHIVAAQLAQRALTCRVQRWRRLLRTRLRGTTGSSHHSALLLIHLIQLLVRLIRLFSHRHARLLRRHRRHHSRRLRRARSHLLRHRGHFSRRHHLLRRRYRTANKAKIHHISNYSLTHIYPPNPHPHSLSPHLMTLSKIHKGGHTTA